VEASAQTSHKVRKMPEFTRPACPRKLIKSYTEPRSLCGLPESGSGTAPFGLHQSHDLNVYCATEFRVRATRSRPLIEHRQGAPAAPLRSVAPRGNSPGSRRSSNAQSIEREIIARVHLLLSIQAHAAPKRLRPRRHLVDFSLLKSEKADSFWIAIPAIDSARPEHSNHSFIWRLVQVLQLMLAVAGKLSQ